MRTGSAEAAGEGLGLGGGGAHQGRAADALEAVGHLADDRRGRGPAAPDVGEEGGEILEAVDGAVAGEQDGGGHARQSTAGSVGVPGDHHPVAVDAPAVLVGEVLGERLVAGGVGAQLGEGDGVVGLDAVEEGRAARGGATSRRPDRGASPGGAGRGWPRGPGPPPGARAG